jgi:hypothetical protein
MQQAQIESQALSAVVRAERGDSDGLTDQLAAMSNADRVAVAKEMLKLSEARDKMDSSLPKIEISLSKDANGTEYLVGVNDRGKRGWYNPARWMGSAYDSGTSVFRGDLRESSGQYDIVDPASGKMKSLDVMTDAGTVHIKVDPATQNACEQDITLISGRTIKTIMDPKTDTVLSLDDSSPDGSATHSTFDPASGNPVMRDVTYQDGHKEHDQFDRTTGQKISADFSYGDGTMAHDEYDPSNGGMTKADITMPSGLIEHREYDSHSGIMTVDKYVDPKTDSAQTIGHPI